MAFTKIEPATLTLKPFSALDKGWALLSAGDAQAFNMMTVSWGGLGTLWGKPVTTVYVRPQRYTREFIERADFYTLCFFDEACRADLALLGRESGRDGDKLAKTGLTPQFDEPGGAPLYAQATLALVCRKLYSQDIDPGRILDPALLAQWYAGQDYHRLYIGEVVRAFRRS